MLYGKDCGPKYRIKFTTALPAFRLFRKLERQRAAKLRPTIQHRYIVAVDPVQSIPVRCIQVDSPSRTYLCGIAMIPTHNSDLLLGLAATAHKKSLIMRAQFNDLDALTERSIQINGTKAGYNGSPPPSLRTVDGRFIQFTGAALEKWQGNRFDFKGFDEGAQLQRSTVKFHLGWVGSVDIEQRTRAVIATNPPVNSQGDWLIGMFRPWLDLTYERPARAGELRWYVIDPDGEDFEVPDSTPYQFPGQADVLATTHILCERVIRPRSTRSRSRFDRPFATAISWHRALIKKIRSFRPIGFWRPTSAGRRTSPIST